MFKWAVVNAIWPFWPVEHVFTSAASRVKKVGGAGSCSFQTDICNFEISDRGDYEC